MITKLSIQKELKEIFDALSESDRIKLFDYFYGKDYRFIETPYMREGQRFSYILSQIIPESSCLKVNHPNLFYCSDSEIVSECLGEFFEKLIAENC